MLLLVFCFVGYCLVHDFLCFDCLILMVVWCWLACFVCSGLLCGVAELLALIVDSVCLGLCWFAFYVLTFLILCFADCLFDFVLVVLT